MCTGLCVPTGFLQMSAMCREPLCLFAECYSSECGVSHHIGIRCLSLFAPMGSCARPKPSHLLQPQPRSVGLCRLLPAPAGRWPFPTLSLQSLHGCLDPYPGVSLQCSYPFLPEEHRPHVRSETFGTPISSCFCNFSRSRLSRLQSFHYVQAPMLARPPGCSHRIILL